MLEDKLGRVDRVAHVDSQAGGAAARLRWVGGGRGRAPAVADVGPGFEGGGGWV